MLNYQHPIDPILHAIAEPTRRAMVERLTRGPAAVSGLAKVFPMSLPAVMQHLAVLEAANVVRSEKVGRVRTVSLNAAALRQLEQWAAMQRTDWERKLDRLNDFLGETFEDGKE